MGWIKLDDGFLDHPKFLRAGPLAGYLHIAAMAWCNRNLTDGVIPRVQPARLVAWHTANDCLNVDVVGRIADHEEAVSWSVLVERLLETGLWVEREDGDYEVHGYLEWQTSAEEIRAKREGLSDARRRAGKKGASSRWNGKPDGKSDGKPMATPSQTDGEEVRRQKVEPPFIPQGGTPDVAPVKPKGNRKTDQDKHNEAMKAWAAHHFPGADPRAVESTIVWTRLDEPVTADALRTAALNNELWASQLGLSNEEAA